MIGYSNESDRQKILDMINAHNNMPMDIAEQQVGKPWEYEWEYEGMKLKGDCAGEELIRVNCVRIKNVYKRGMLQGLTHAVLCGNGGGAMCTIRFLNQYIRGKGMHGVGITWFEKAMEKRFEAEQRERSRSPRSSRAMPVPRTNFCKGDRVRGAAWFEEIAGVTGTVVEAILVTGDIWAAQDLLVRFDHPVTILEGESPRWTFFHSAHNFEYVDEAAA